MDLNKNKLLTLYPEYTSVLGPYLRKDGRSHIVLNNDSAPRSDKKKTITISYPKAIIEVEIGRRLALDETVDHIDRDFTNNSINNLRIVNRSQHTSDDNLRVKKINCECVWCGKSFERSARSLTQSSKKGYAGPFCSSYCTGIYGSGVQNGQVKEFEPQKPIPVEDRIYFYIEK